MKYQLTKVKRVHAVSQLNHQHCTEDFGQVFGTTLIPSH